MSRAGKRGQTAFLQRGARSIGRGRAKQKRIPAPVTIKMLQLRIDAAEAVAGESSDQNQHADRKPICEGARRIDESIHLKEFLLLDEVINLPTKTEGIIVTIQASIPITGRPRRLLYHLSLSSLALMRVAPTLVLKYNIRTRCLADAGAIEDVLAVENDVVPFDRADVPEQGCIDAFLGDSPGAQSPRDLLGLPIDDASQNLRFPHPPVKNPPLEPRRGVISTGVDPDYLLIRASITVLKDFSALAAAILAPPQALDIDDLAANTSTTV